MLDVRSMEGLGRTVCIDATMAQRDALPQ